MSTTVTWLGHATAFVRFAETSFLIDPLGRSRSRSVGQVNTVLITHSHVDHLNRWTLGGLNKSARLIVPKGSLDIVRNLGFSEVLEAEPGDHFDCDGVDVIAVETRHDTGRWKKSDKPVCVGYILQKNGIIVHHAGDVDMSTYDVFDEIGKKYEIDATLLPIGGMLPPWYYQNRQSKIDKGVHICPETALGIAQRLGARAMVPIHWGTVNLRLFHRRVAPAKILVDVAVAQNLEEFVQVLAHGDALALTARDGSELNP